MRKRFCFAICMLLSVLCFSKEKIAIVDFSEKGAIKSPQAGQIVADLFSAALAEKYQLIERAKINKVIAEQSFIISDLISNNKAAGRLGTLLSADKLVVGNIAALGDTITVDASVFNVSTGKWDERAYIYCASLGEIPKKLPELLSKVKLTGDDGIVAPVKSLNQPLSDKGRDMTVPGLGMKLVYVAPGSFQMGAADGEIDEKPVHQVTISRGYWIGKHEVTQNDYQLIMGSNPSYFKGGGKPVEQVSWNDAVSFCQKLTEVERAAGRLPDGCVYRLPTEAEWEFAVRGGNSTRGYVYSGSNNIANIAWNEQNSGQTTHDVGMKEANEIGIHDMSGNVWEWCLDLHNTYSANPVVDPVGASSESFRIIRGGSWSTSSRFCRSADRHSRAPAVAYDTIGFRVVLGPK